MTTKTIKPKARTITLTDRAPVKIVEDEWPVIAEAAGDSYQGDSSRRYQAEDQGEIDTYTLKVRQHADGRAIVYGIVDAAHASWNKPARGENWRGGELVASGTDLAKVIRRVAEQHVPDSLIRACIADLPAEEL